MAHKISKLRMFILIQYVFLYVFHRYEKRIGDKGNRQKRQKEKEKEL